MCNFIPVHQITKKDKRRLYGCYFCNCVEKPEKVRTSSGIIANLPLYPQFNIRFISYIISSFTNLIGETYFEATRD